MLQLRMLPCVHSGSPPERMGPVCPSARVVVSLALWPGVGMGFVIDTAGRSTRRLTRVAVP